MSRDIATDPPGGPRPHIRPAAADVLVCNHDDCDHYVAVRVYDDGGDVAFESGFDLEPGGVVPRPDVLAAGAYTVEADCDAEKYLVTACEIARPPAALLVAVGNGVVDVAAVRRP